MVHHTGSASPAPESIGAALYGVVHVWTSVGDAKGSARAIENASLSDCGGATRLSRAMCLR